MLRSWTALSAAVGLALVTALTTTPASAQGLVNVVNVVREGDEDDGQDIDDHINWFNRRDCLNNVRVTFALGTTGTVPQSADLHVWASSGGVACENQASRDDPGCKQVYQAEVFAGGTLQRVSAEINVRDLVRPGYGVLPDTPQTEEVCDQDQDRKDVVLRFFVLDTGDHVLPGVVTYDVSYDLVGPPAPTSVSAGVGEDALTVTWKASSSDEFLGTYYVYADEAGGSPPGAGGEGGGGSTPSNGCTSDDLVPGEIPTVAHNEETNASTTEAEAGGLTNGVLYAVGVSSVDNFKNPGPLSNLDCAIPEPVTGFFEAYRDAGGQGGGGYCAVGAAPSLASTAFVGIAALGLLARRRTRSAARRPS